MARCRTCKQQTTQKFGLTYACSVEHALAFVNAQAAKRERIRLRQRKAELKTLPQLVKEAQSAFNSFIRARDKDLPCISCGVFGPRKWDAGHYLSTGAHPELRFDEANCHAQCVPCNQHKSGNQQKYRIGLLMRLGEAEVNRLEGPHEPLKLTRQDAIDIKATYKAKLKALQNPPA